MPWIPTPSDGLETSETLRSQYETEQIISTLLTEQLAGSTPTGLELDTHVAFCRRLLDHPLPAYFVGLDASRPWVLYWTLHSLAIAGQPIDAALRARTAATLSTFQNADGGFGGGPGQLSHLAPTYAAVCALAYAGEEGWDVIDR
jgi:protein farnesyltransferase subunit beta